MTSQELERIASLCRVYLTNYHHASRREHTMKIVRRLHDATAEQAELPTLGVQVSDGLAMREKVGG